MHTHVLRAAFLLAASGAALMAGTAHAQDAVSAESETAVNDEDSAPAPQDSQIVVTGTRAALNNAERVKQNADVILDGISADDIGALPDASMAEALIRVPGAYASGNGGLSARGMGPDFIAQLVNGRVIPSPTPQTRIVQSGSFPTEGITGLYLQKTPDGKTIEGATGGLILFQVIKPLETRRSGLELVVRGYTNTQSAALSDAEGYANVAPRFSATYVARPTDNFGIALTYASVREYKAFIWNDSTTWRFDNSAAGNRADLNGDGTPDALPNTLGEQVGPNNDFRQSAIGMVQWDVTPALRMSVDGFFNSDRFENSIRRYFATNIFNGSNGVPTSATVNEFDTVVAMSGQVSSYRGTVEYTRATDKTFGGGVNLVFNNGGPIAFSVDGSWFKATRRGQNPSFTFDNDANNTAGQRLPFSFDVSDHYNAIYDFVALAPEDYALASGSYAEPVINDTIAAFRADFTYTPQSGGLFKSVDVGFRLDRRYKTNRPYTENYSFGVAANGSSNLALRPDLDSSYLEMTTNPLAGRNPYVSGANTGTFPWFDIDKLSALIGAPNSTTALAPGIISGFIDDTETTAALYGQVNIERGALSGNAGVRYVLTDVDIKGLQGDLTNSTLATVTNNYGYLLPALNLKLQLTPTLDVRLGLSKTLTRPVFSDTKIATTFNPTVALTNGFATISSGNPDLRPYTSKSIDAAIEWFPGKGTSIVLSGYAKFLKDFLVTTTQTGTVTVQGTILPATISTVINDPSITRFGGIELAVRQDLNFLPGVLSGFGVYFNWNLSFTDAKETVASLIGTTADIPATNFTRHVINAQLYYSRGPLDVRFAYRYFSDNSETGLNPVYFRSLPGGTLDISGRYAVSRNFSLLFSMTNVIYPGDYRYIPDYRFPDNDYQTNQSLTSGVRGVGQTIQAGFRFQF